MVTARRHFWYRPRRGATLLAGLLLVLSTAWGCGGLRRDAGPIFFPPAPDPPRIQYLTSFQTQEDIGDKPSVFASLVLGKQTRRKGIVKPFGTATHDGVIYVADIVQGKVLTLDLKQHKFDYLRDDNNWKGKLKQPIGLFIEPDGTKYVADSGRRQVVVFGADNRFKMTLGDGKEMRPIDVAVSGDRIFVSDIENNLIRVYEKQAGKPLFTFGGLGAKEGEFNKPTYLTVDSQGHLYVTDLLNFRIQKFDRDGKFLWAFGEAGDRPGTFARPKGVAVDRDGYIYVVDAGFENVQIFDKEGNVLMFFGGPGNLPGRMYLPAKIYIDYDQVTSFQRYVDKNFEIKYLLLVTNQFGNHSLSVYGFGKLKE